MEFSPCVFVGRAAGTWIVRRENFSRLESALQSILNASLDLRHPRKRTPFPRFRRRQRVFRVSFSPSPDQFPRFPPPPPPPRLRPRLARLPNLVPFSRPDSTARRPRNAHSV